MPVLSALAVRALGSTFPVLRPTPLQPGPCQTQPDHVFSFGRGKEFGPIFLARPCWSFPLRVSSAAVRSCPSASGGACQSARPPASSGSRPSRLASHPPNCSGLGADPALRASRPPLPPKSCCDASPARCGWGEREMCCGSRWQVGAVVDLGAGHLHVILRLLCLRYTSLRT